MSIKVTFSPFFTITGFKKFHRLFFTYQESIWRFWFSSNYHELCLWLPCVWLTVKENDRETPQSLFLVPLSLSWNLAGYKLMYSPQGYTSTRTTAVVEIAVSICLKSLKSLLGGAPAIPRSSFLLQEFCKNFLGEWCWNLITLNWRTSLSIRIYYFLMLC